VTSITSRFARRVTLTFDNNKTVAPNGNRNFGSMSAGFPRPQTSNDPPDVQGVMHVPHTPQEPCHGFDLARSGLTIRAGFSFP